MLSEVIILNLNRNRGIARRSISSNGIARQHAARAGISLASIGVTHPAGALIFRHEASKAAHSTGCRC